MALVRRRDSAEEEPDTPAGAEMYDFAVVKDLPPEFEELRKRTAELMEEEYWVVDELDDAALQFRLRAAAACSAGGSLRKFRKGGKVDARRCFCKVVGSATGGLLTWQSGRVWKSEAIVRADAELFESCFRGDIETIDRELCFQVILQKRMLFLLASSHDQKQQWVSGINAIVTGRAVVLAVESTMRVADGHSERSERSHRRGSWEENSGRSGRSSQEDPAKRSGSLGSPRGGSGSDGGGGGGGGKRSSGFFGKAGSLLERVTSRGSFGAGRSSKRGSTLSALPNFKATDEGPTGMPSRPSMLVSQPWQPPTTVDGGGGGGVSTVVQDPLTGATMYLNGGTNEATLMQSTRSLRSVRASSVYRRSSFSTSVALAERSAAMSTTAGDGGSSDSGEAAGAGAGAGGRGPASPMERVAAASTPRWGSGRLMLGGGDHAGAAAPGAAPGAAAAGGAAPITANESTLLPSPPSILKTPSELLPPPMLRAASKNRVSFRESSQANMTFDSQASLACASSESLPRPPLLHGRSSLAETSEISAAFSQAETIEDAYEIADKLAEQSRERRQQLDEQWREAEEMRRSAEVDSVKRAEEAKAQNFRLRLSLAAAAPAAAAAAAAPAAAAAAMPAAATAAAVTAPAAAPAVAAPGTAPSGQEEDEEDDDDDDDDDGLDDGADEASAVTARTPEEAAAAARVAAAKAAAEKAQKLSAEAAAAAERLSQIKALAGAPSPAFVAFKLGQEEAEAAKQREAEATGCVQLALLTQDVPTVRAALLKFGPVLRNGSQCARRDLAAAESYLEQLATPRGAGAARSSTKGGAAQPSVRSELPFGEAVSGRI